MVRNTLPCLANKIEGVDVNDYGFVISHKTTRTLKAGVVRSTRSQVQGILKRKYPDYDFLYLVSRDSSDKVFEIYDES